MDTERCHPSIPCEASYQALRNAKYICQAASENPANNVRTFTKIGVFHSLFGIKWTLCWRAVNRIYVIFALASAFRPREVFVYSLSKFRADNVTDFLLN